MLQNYFPNQCLFKRWLKHKCLSCAVCICGGVQCIAYSVQCSVCSVHCRVCRGKGLPSLPPMSSAHCPRELTDWGEGGGAGRGNREIYWEFKLVLCSVMDAKNIVQCRKYREEKRLTLNLVL